MNTDQTTCQNARREFLQKVFSPEDFQILCDQIDYSADTARAAEDYVWEMLKGYAHDTATMDRIIDAHTDGEVLEGFVLATSIELVQGHESTYFESLYEIIVNIGIEKGSDSQTTRSYERAKSAAITRITNEARVSEFCL